MICDHVPGVKGWDVGSRRKKRFAAAAPLLSQTQLEHAAFRNRFEGIQGAIDKALLIGMRQIDRIAQAVRAYFPISAEN